MIIYFFTPGDRNLPSSRTRVYIVSDKLKELGIETKITRIVMRPWWDLSLNRLKDFVKNFKILLSTKSEDIIYLQKTTSQLDFLFLILFFNIFFGKKYYFDIDDAIFLYSKNMFLKTKILCKFAEGVIVGSHYLYDFAVEFNKRVVLIPTSVDIDEYVFNEKWNEKIVLGWVGNAKVHYNNLQLLKPVLEELIKKGIEFKFVIVGAVGNKEVYSFFNSIENIDVSFVDQIDWTNTENVIKFIQGFDIGIMPLENSEWNKGKCAFKAVEYMACGVPVIISNVGENKFLIKNNVNGFLVENKYDWIKTVSYLILKDKERLEMGLKGRKTIEDRYSYRVNIPKLISFLK